MPRTAIRFAIGLLLVIAALVALAPATIVDAALDARTRGAWRMADARGLWWRGRGVLASDDGRARMPIAWRVALRPVARGVLSVELDSGSDGARGTIDVRPGTLSLHGFELRAPAALAAALTPRGAALTIGGVLELHAAAFEWSPSGGTSGGSGALDAQWQRARLVVAGTTVDLGTVALELAPRQGRLEGTVRNSGGELAVDGTIVGSGGSVDAALTLTASSATPEALRRTLPMLGAQDAAGAVHLAWHGGR
ncbi:MAG TPA: type II secretion system protein N [Casimicrobiaceae bacterium]|nr:type II secretion system protein N [Casimicrobiaceae bacterium]